MHELEHAILGVFKASPEATRSTTELVQELLSHEWDAIQEQLRSLDPALVRRGKTAKARLHRKLLYHVNKLVSDGLLQVHGVQGRGEKRFALVSGAGDVEIRSGRKQIRIRKPTKISTPVDEVEGIHVFDREHWLERVNAVLVEGMRHETLGSLAEYVLQVAPHVNDIIGVARAETLLGGTIAEYEAFIEQLNRVHCNVALIMSVSLLGEDAKLIRFCRVMSEVKPKNVHIVLNVTPHCLQERREVVTEVVKLFVKNNIKVNVKNSSTHKPPIICGKGGPYTLSDKDWQEYQAHRQHGVVLGGASIAVDVGKHQPAHKAVRKAAEALFLVGRARQNTLRSLGLVTAFITDVVRWWNYDLSNELLATELEASVSVVDEFCTLQERVYRACGLPIRCRIAVSCAFGTFHGVSMRAYSKRTIHGLSSLQEEEVAGYLETREQLAQRFSADRVRMFRAGTVDAVAIVRELSFLLNSFAFPYVTYDFRGLQGNVQLTQFFGGGE